MNGDMSQKTAYVGTEFFPDGRPVPALMTQQELALYLRIPEISKAKDYNNVIKNLIRFRDLPRISLCNKVLFPREAVLEWIRNQTIWN